MAIYIVEILSIFALNSICKKSIKFYNKKINSKNVYLLIIFCMFGLTMALRAVSIGSDTQTYRYIYQSIKGSSTFSQALENSSISSAPVYVFIEFLLSRLPVIDQTSIFVNSIIVSGGFYYYIKNNSKNYMLSSFLFVGLALFFESMNGTRQFMAIALALNAYAMLKQDLKSVKGWLLFLLAIGIHNTISAFLLVIAGILIKRKINNYDKALSLSVICGAAISVGFSVLIEVASKIFPYFNIYLNGTNAAQINENVGNGRIVILFVFLGLLIILSAFYIKKNRRIAREVDYVDTFACITCVILGIIFARNVLAIRIIWSFMCVFMVYLPNVFELMRSKTKKVMMQGTISVLLAYCILFLVEDKSSIVPYVFYWMK